MHLHEFFGSISVLFVVSGFAPYIYNTLNSRTQPHLYSWIIWSLIQGTGVWIIIAEGGGWGGASLAAGTALCIIVALLSLKYGTKNITTLDTVCLLAALVALLGYATVREPYSSLTLAIFIDSIGFVPTFRKGIAEPNSETKSTWMLFAMSNVFALVALQRFTILTAAYSTVLLACEMTLVMILFLQSRRH